MKFFSNTLTLAFIQEDIIYFSQSSDNMIDLSWKSKEYLALNSYENKGTYDLM